MTLDWDKPDIVLEREQVITIALPEGSRVVITAGSMTWPGSKVEVFEYRDEDATSTYHRRFPLTNGAE